MKIIKFLGLNLTFSVLFIISGCQRANNTETGNLQIVVSPPQSSKTPIILPKPEQTIPINVTKLAGKSSAELDNFFGTAEESELFPNDSEYRLYKIVGQSKGLAVRFKRGKAWSFNLILDKPFSTSKEALKQVFNIDVGNSAPVKDAKEPLSEKYQGVFGGVKFTKVSAKKQENGKGFIFVLAEVGE